MEIPPAGGGLLILLRIVCCMAWKDKYRSIEEKNPVPVDIIASTEYYLSKYGQGREYSPAVHSNNNAKCGRAEMMGPRPRIDGSQARESQLGRYCNRTLSELHVKNWKALIIISGTSLLNTFWTYLLCICSQLVGE